MASASYGNEEECKVGNGGRFIKRSMERHARILSRETRKSLKQESDMVCKS